MLSQRQAHLPRRRRHGQFGRGGGRASGRKRAARFDPGGVPYRRGFGGRNMAAAVEPVTEKVSNEAGLC